LTLPAFLQKLYDNKIVNVKLADSKERNGNPERQVAEKGLTFFLNPRSKTGSSMVSTCPDMSPSSLESIWRHYLRQEPGAVVPLAGI
jgi:hypothetical protein